MLLSYTVISACTSPRNSIWFNRLFLLARGWDLGMKLIHHEKIKSVGCLKFLWSKAGTVGVKITLKVEVTLLAHCHLPDKAWSSYLWILKRMQKNCTKISPSV